jgi:K+-sensing histidine kinase KdpD
MNQNRYLLISPRRLMNSIKAVAIVLVSTVPLVLIGRQALGEAVIALVYLVPVAWAANRWGQAAGMSAALTAALCFDFYFIPPFYTMVVGSLESWIVLAIFMGVAIVVVGRIHASLTRAREAVFMYELSEALGGLRTRDAVAHTVAQHIQQMYQASLVNVIYRPSKESPSVVASEPPRGMGNGRPDCVIPILNAWGLIGEIQMWKGDFTELRPADSRLFQNFGLQTARGLERTQLMELEDSLRSSNQRSAVK